VSYLHCPSCERTAWLDSAAEPPRSCRHCETALAPMPARYAGALTGAVRERFEHDMRLDADRPRFVRG
jgi:hypothetical protein